MAFGLRDARCPRNTGYELAGMPTTQRTSKGFVDDPERENPWAVRWEIP